MFSLRWSRLLRRLLVVAVGVAAGALIAHLSLLQPLLGGLPLLDRLIGLVVGAVIALALLVNRLLTASDKGSQPH